MGTPSFGDCWSIERSWAISKRQCPIPKGKGENTPGRVRHCPPAGRTAASRQNTRLRFSSTVISPVFCLNTLRMDGPWNAECVRALEKVVIQRMHKGVSTKQLPRIALTWSGLGVSRKRKRTVGSGSRRAPSAAGCKETHRTSCTVYQWLELYV